MDIRPRGEYVTAAHLGGFFAGGDPDTFYPRLWEWLVAKLEVRDVLDVGCGDGIALDYFGGLVGDEHVAGIDGMPQSQSRIFRHDFTLGPWAAPWEWSEPGLVWCCEFVEHVEEQYVGNFLPLLASGRYLAMTHAVPGQGGHHHVNCQPGEYWVSRLAQYGMVLDEHLTAEAREVTAADAAPFNYFAHTGMIFERQ